jgi:hypothetical protein
LRFFIPFYLIPRHCEVYEILKYLAKTSKMRCSERKKESGGGGDENGFFSSSAAMQPKGRERFSGNVHDGICYQKGSPPLPKVLKGRLPRGQISKV